MSCGRIRTCALWLSLLIFSGCGPAPPVSLSTVRLEFGESGTLFYNEAQRSVERGQSLELFLQLPLDIHFNSGTDWQSVRVVRTSTIAFGTSFGDFGSGDLTEVELAGADEVIALCDGRLFESSIAEISSDERVLRVPSRTECTLLGLKMDGRFPTHYELRVIESERVDRVIFQPATAFEQSLRVGTDSPKPGYLNAFLTLGGVLTELPLGEGGIVRGRGLAVLSPPEQAQELGVWLLMNERTVADAQRAVTVGAHIDRQRSSVLLEYPAEVAYSSSPGELMSQSLWTNGIGFAEPPPSAQFEGRITSLTGSDRSTWLISLPLEDELSFPERPFASPDMYDHVRATYDLVWSTDGEHRVPSSGQAVPAQTWKVQSLGYFRVAGCDQEVQVYGYWSSIETCELEMPLHSVLIDECGVLIPFQGRDQIESGNLDGDRFIRPSGMAMPVERMENGVLLIGRGAQAFTLTPSFSSALELPDELIGIRGAITVTEQVYEFQNGALGLALDEPVLVYSSPWQTVAPYQATLEGELIIWSSVLSARLFLVSSDRGVNGLTLGRQVPLCPSYSEQFFLRDTQDGIVLEQLINQEGSQTILRRLYTFH